MCSLDAAWRRALELAWESYMAGTTPVGAVVTDAASEKIKRWRPHLVSRPPDRRGWRVMPWRCYPARG